MALCGYHGDDIVGRPIQQLFRIVNEASHEPLESVVDQVRCAGESTNPASQTILVRADRSETPVEQTARPIYDESGELSGIVVVIRDVTEKRRAMELQASLAAIVESSDDVIVTKNLHGIITSWNKGAETVLGYRANEVVGKHVSMLMPEGHLEDIEKILGRVAKGQRVEHYETKRRRKDGTSIDVSPIRNSHGEIIGASKVGRDITEKRRTEELRERLAAIVASSDDMIVSKNLDGVILSWNRGAERILGYAAEEIVGKHVSLLMPPEQAEDYTKILSRIRRGESVDHYETRRRRKDGGIVDISLTVSPIRDADGKIIGASKIGRDITQQKLAEAERKEADRRKDEFLAMLAHELRNPLASIDGAVQLFGRLETEEELEWAKDVVQRQVRHLGRLIDDLLDVSRITRGKIGLRKEIVDVSPIVATAVETVRSMMEERKHELSVSLAAGSLRVDADPLRMEQILVNLLTNAAKYTDAGGKISLTIRREGDRLAISVRDTGIGISAELLPRVFDMFVQGDRSIARTEGGLGIGLTLVHKLAEMHDGSVTALSEGPGKGSEFIVRVPTSGQDSSKPPTESHSTNVGRAGARVLVVDDNADTALGLAKLLKLLGHDVQTASDGLQAVERAKILKPEIILLDIGLPGMNGYQVAQLLRQEDCCRDALLIAVSGYGQDEDRRRSMESGFDHHLVKPVDFNTLMAVIAEA